MAFPIKVTYLPADAEPATELPTGSQWCYEPKWDGFRCLAFRDGAKIDLESKSQKSLSRYFPELVRVLKKLKTNSFILDGEIVIPVDGDLSFDSLLMRIHPAASRVQKLSEETPCVFVVFDLLADGESKLVNLSFRERRKRLEVFFKRVGDTSETLELSPVTSDIKTARRWFHIGVGLDGIVAKRLDLPYQSGKRTGMLKIKTKRTADCVVGGFRYLAQKRLIGSLLLGLYNERGTLDHVGYTSSIRNQDRMPLTKKLERMIKPPGFTGKSPGGPSRWSTKHSSEWEPLDNKLVVEVQFDHFTGGRFRHGTSFIRWRPDKAPRACTMKQVQRENSSALKLL